MKESASSEADLCPPLTSLTAWVEGLSEPFDATIGLQETRTGHLLARLVPLTRSLSPLLSVALISCLHLPTCPLSVPRGLPAPAPLPTSQHLLSQARAWPCHSLVPKVSAASPLLSECWNPHLASDVLQPTPLTPSHVLACSFQNILSIPPAPPPFCSPSLQLFPSAISACHVLSCSLGPGQMSKVTRTPLPGHTRRTSWALGPLHPAEVISRCTFSVCSCEALCTYCFISPSRSNIPPGIGEVGGPPRDPSTACVHSTGMLSLPAPALGCTPPAPLWAESWKKLMVKNRFYFPRARGYEPNMPLGFEYCPCVFVSGVCACLGHCGHAPSWKRTRTLIWLCLGAYLYLQEVPSK